MESFEIVEVCSVDEIDHITNPYMTKYEYAKLVGYRAVMLAHGHPPCIEYDKSVPYDPVKIAKQEVDSLATPLHIKRQLPDGRIDVWSVSEMHIIDH